MMCKQLLLPELNELESSILVLAQASRAVLGPVDHIDYLRDEVPLAVEDAERALKELRRLALALEEAA